MDYQALELSKTFQLLLHATTYVHNVRHHITLHVIMYVQDFCTQVYTHTHANTHTRTHTQTPHIWIKDEVYHVKIMLAHRYTQARTCIAHAYICAQTHTRAHMYTYTHTHTHMYTPITTQSTIPHLDNTDHLQKTHCLGKLKFFFAEYILCMLAVLSHHFINLLFCSYKKH